MRILLLLGLLPPLAACRAEEEQAQKNAESYAQQVVQLISTAAWPTVQMKAKSRLGRKKPKCRRSAQMKSKKWGFEPAVRKAWGGHSPNGGRFLLAAGGQYCSVKARGR